MDDRLRTFLESSPLAERVRLKARVVLHRARLTPRGIRAIREAGRYGPIPRPEELCELEVGGQVVARGRIVRRRGECWFQVLETGGQEGRR